MSDLSKHVEAIVYALENGKALTSCRECGADNPKELTEPCAECGADMYVDGFEYVNDAMEVDYLITEKKDFKGASLLVAFGGPNIWVKVGYNSGTVEGHWWGESYTATYRIDFMNVYDAASERYDCS
tara:strand:- start:70 stop:450 length:381 start_codon:yes stop_codon:yes gene_type:complete